MLIQFDFRILTLREFLGETTSKKNRRKIFYYSFLGLLGPLNAVNNIKYESYNSILF